ncbi:hypothetical protein [Nocardioides astragali]|uniref:Uncharacterized protein n=1 Tax=Nocardioides astragali TaxID=1776736 RepID=A0ABW2MY51_9ACTN|nr:hypothetical protein [Nocardioides astragali]
MKAERRDVPTGRLMRLGAALAIVIGLFGMHVLSHHGMPHEQTTAAPISTSAAHADGGHSTTRAEDPARTAPVHGAGDAGATGHSLGDLLMLCVAMLAAVSTLLGLYALGGRTHRPWAILRPAATHVRPALRLAPTGTGPPPVWQFSVIRC